jgi:pseudouridine-5'-phosphate glycosidase
MRRSGGDKGHGDWRHWRGPSRRRNIDGRLCGPSRTRPGAKSILDLGRTLEVLETNGVPVAGFRTGHFPAFYTQKSGHPVAIRVDTATEAADLIAAHQSIPNAGGIVIANPVPAAAAIPSQDVDKWILNALTEAQESGVSGKELTPFLLSALARLSNGATLEANIALLENNAGVAAEIAVALHAA